MNKIKISRDKKNPTWAWVGYNKSGLDSKEEKRIILDTTENGCICIDKPFEKEYQENKKYFTTFWPYYEIEIIEKPKYRDFKNHEEFCNWLRATGRTDMRICRKNNKNIFYTISNTDFIDYKRYFHEYVWFNDLSPVGIQK